MTENRHKDRYNSLHKYLIPSLAKTPYYKGDMKSLRKFADFADQIRRIWSPKPPNLVTKIGGFGL